METYYSKKDLIKAKNDDTNYIYDLTDLEEFLEDVPTADVVPRDEVEMHGASYYFKLEQAIESSQRFMAEHDAALAKKIFGEIELFLNKAIDGWRKERKFAYSDRQIEMIDFRNGAFKYCLHEIAELKEKYTKGGAR